jgi:hypothetical protein
MTKLLSALAVAFVALLIACENGDGGEVAPTVGVTPAVTVSPQADGETPTPGETPTGEDVCQPNPDPATPDTAQVDSPAPGDSVTSPVTVSGRMAAFEAQFNIAIFDATGDPIVDVPGHTEEGFVLSPFSEDVAFSVSGPKPACIWVYDISERDGRPIQIVQIPVTLLP